MPYEKSTAIRPFLKNNGGELVPITRDKDIHKVLTPLKITETEGTTPSQVQAMKRSKVSTTTSSTDYTTMDDTDTESNALQVYPTNREVVRKVKKDNSAEYIQRLHMWLIHSNLNTLN